MPGWVAVALITYPAFTFYKRVPSPQLGTFNAYSDKIKLYL